MHCLVTAWKLSNTLKINRFFAHKKMPFTQGVLQCAPFFRVKAS